jgi:hypothetical protein
LFRARHGRVDHCQNWAEWGKTNDPRGTENGGRPTGTVVAPPNASLTYGIKTRLLRNNDTVETLDGNGATTTIYDFADVPASDLSVISSVYDSTTNKWTYTIFWNSSISVMANHDKFRIHRTLSNKDNYDNDLTVTTPTRVPQKWDIKITATSSSGASGSASKKIGVMSLVTPIQDTPKVVSKYGPRPLSGGAPWPTYSRTTGSQPQTVTVNYVDDLGSDFHAGTDYPSSAQNPVYASEYGNRINAKFDHIAGDKAFNADIIKGLADDYVAAHPDWPLSELYIFGSKLTGGNSDFNLGPRVEIQHTQKGTNGISLVNYDVARANAQSPYVNFKSTITTIYAHMDTTPNDPDYPRLPTGASATGLVEIRNPISFTGAWYPGNTAPNYGNTQANFEANPLLLLRRGYISVTGPLYLAYKDSNGNWVKSESLGEQTIYFPSLAGSHLHIEVRHNRTGNETSTAGSHSNPDLWLNKYLDWKPNATNPNPPRVDIIKP